MNKPELVSKIAEISGESKRLSGEMLEAVVEAVAMGIAEDGEVKLVGFGNFEIVDVAARNGHNPQTGEPMTVAAHKRVAFRPSKNLKAAVNK